MCSVAGGTSEMENSRCWGREVVGDRGSHVRLFRSWQGC